jgi:hypothetical protein
MYFNPVSNFKINICEKLKKPNREDRYKLYFGRVPNKLCSALMSRLNKGDFLKNQLELKNDQSLFYYWLQRHLYTAYLNLKTNLNTAKTNMDVISFAVLFYRDFISIHPFFNGNGRLAKLILKKILNDFNLPAPIIYPSGVDVTLKVNDLTTVIADSIALSMQFQKDLIYLLRNNLPYSYSYINFLAPGFFPKFIKPEDIVIAEFMSWVMMSDDLKKVANNSIAPKYVISKFVDKYKKNKNNFHDWFVSTGLDNYKIMELASRINKFYLQELDIYNKFLNIKEFNDFDVFPFYHNSFINSQKYESMSKHFFNDYRALKILEIKKIIMPEQKKVLDAYKSIVSSPNYHFKYYVMYVLTKKFINGNLEYKTLMDFFSYIESDNKEVEAQRDYYFEFYKRYLSKYAPKLKNKILDAREYFFVHNYTIAPKKNSFDSDKIPIEKSFFQQIHYNDINLVNQDSYLNGKTPYDIERKKLEWLIKLNTIAAIKKIGQYKGKSYSAMPINWDTIISLKKGQYVCFPLFLSSTKNKEKLEFFRSQLNVDYVFKINSIKGFSVRDYSLYPSEDEVVFLPYTRFKFKKVEEIKKSREINASMIIELEGTSFMADKGNIQCTNLMTNKAESPRENYYIGPWK